MGTKNHSRMFVPEIRNAFHAITIAGFMKALTTPVEALGGRPPPFCLMADKAIVAQARCTVPSSFLMGS